MNRHTATTPDGKVFTRNSKTRVYTHALAVYDRDDERHVIIRWSGDYFNAHKAIGQYVRPGSPFTNPTIVPVTLK